MGGSECRIQLGQRLGLLAQVVDVHATSSVVDAGEVARAPPAHSQRRMENVVK
jgi:hypothetical protein